MNLCSRCHSGRIKVYHYDDKVLCVEARNKYAVQCANCGNHTRVFETHEEAIRQWDKENSK